MLSIFYLGTHEIYDIFVSYPRTGIIRVMGQVVIGSTSKGILAVIYSVFNACYQYVSHNSTQPGVYLIDTCIELPDSLYEIAVFVVEENQHPFSRAAAIPVSIPIYGNLICGYYYFSPQH